MTNDKMANQPIHQKDESFNFHQNTRFVDLLDERRLSSDLRFSCKEWTPSTSYKYASILDRETLFMKVLKSDRVQNAIAEMIGEKDFDALENEVLDILEQMGHTLHIGMIRRFAYILSKVSKVLYRHIFINEGGIEKIKQSIPETPVLFLPTHRSYADFLLVSFMAFHFDIPLPVIAAGMDFMSMAFVGDMLRGAGAFFIRRSFVGDPLYWAVFQEYVQLLITEDSSPMEFFLEGTRSRSGKCLTPKLGLLGCATESWLRGSIPDITIIPLSISYNRTLEEKLYSYELLGVPKPKESTSGLFKAMSILKEDYGNIYVNVGEPLSVRKFLEPRIQRPISISMPLHLCPLTKKELVECEALGLHVLRHLQKGAVISLWSLSCIVLEQHLWKGQWSIPFPLLLKEVDWLSHLIVKLGGMVGVESSIEESLLLNLKTHHSTVSLSPDGVVFVKKIHNTESPLMIKDKKQSFVKLSERTIENAVTHLMLQHYINQSLHIFIRPALVAFSLVTLSSPTSMVGLSELEERFFFLKKLFESDFIFESDLESQDFHEGLSVVTWSGEVGIVHNQAHFAKSNRPFVNLLMSLIRPFVTTYQMTASVAIGKEWQSEGDLVSAVQTTIEGNIVDSNVYSALSLDSIKQFVKSLYKLKALFKQPVPQETCKLLPEKEILGNVISCLNFSDPVQVVSKL